MVCSPQRSLSRAAIQAKTVLGKFQHPSLLKCLLLFAWKLLYCCTAMLILSAFKNAKLSLCFLPPILPAPKGESPRGPPCLLFYRSVGQALLLLRTVFTCCAIHLSWCICRLIWKSSVWMKQIKRDKSTHQHPFQEFLPIRYKCFALLYHAELMVYSRFLLVALREKWYLSKVTSETWRIACGYPYSLLSTWM